MIDERREDNDIFDACSNQKIDNMFKENNDPSQRKETERILKKRVLSGTKTLAYNTNPTPFSVQDKIEQHQG